MNVEFEITRNVNDKDVKIKLVDEELENDIYRIFKKKRGLKWKTENLIL